MPTYYEIPREALAALEPAIMGFICETHKGCPHSLGCECDPRSKCNNVELCKRAQRVQDAILGRKDK
jgi:hypothetical protein